ncbi:unnamed protein product, partial [Amoebophrya sp. A120]
MKPVLCCTVCRRRDKSAAEKNSQASVLPSSPSKASNLSGTISGVGAGGSMASFGRSFSMLAEDADGSGNTPS